MVNVKINNIEVKVDKNFTVLQACNYININIPKFCFHDYLEIAGNCRMCLVEIKNSPKPVASCAMPIADKMEIFTDTPLVKKARESVLEFLLVNHPLDCPICDQGGECDLQDETSNFGSDRSRFFEIKRAVEDKNCGPFIKTIMTRCIHCTRCVRFSQEFSNTDFLGTIGRGNKTEISFYLNNIFNSEFSGNVVDLCPVGALTLKPYSFKARPWELKKRHSIDIFDTTNCDIVIQTLNNKIIRILPKKNNIIFNEWISDKTRFFNDSLLNQRIEYPLYNENNNLKKITWEKSFNIINNKILKTDPSKIKALIGNLIEIKSLFFFKKLLNSLGISNIDYLGIKYKNNNLNSDITGDFLFNNDFKTILKSDLCLLINTNTRLENPILNLNLNTSVYKNNLKIVSIGNSSDLSYVHNNLGLSFKSLLSIIEGKHLICKDIIKSKNFTIILGSNLYNYKNIKNLIDILKIKFKYKVNILQSESNFINFIESFSKINNKKINTNLNFYINTESSIKNKNCYNIYVGHHLTKDALNSNLILPCSTFFEQNSIYVNNEGFIKKTNKVLEKNNENRSFFSISTQLLFFLHKINSLHFKINKNTNYLKYLLNNNLKIQKKKIKCTKIFNIKLYINNMNNKINNIYFTNIFEKYSKNLMNNTQKLNKKKNFKVYDI